MEDKRNSIGNILRVAVSVCLVCAVVVSTAAVVLRPYQEENRMAFRQLNILQAAGLHEPGVDVQALFAERIERRFVDLDTGDYVDMPAEYDMVRAARDPEASRSLTEDPAGIGRRVDVGEVFLARDEDGNLTRLILPVHGYGLWSTMYGFLAIESDLNTISGIQFFEHGETPGLGGEIDNPRWQARWEGQKLFDEEGNLAIRVERGPVPEGVPDPEHRVDGLSGATITARGVHNMVRFWLGENGYGPYLERLERRQRTGEVI